MKAFRSLETGSARTSRTRGQIINFTGSPVASLAGAKAAPGISATQAIVSAKRNVEQGIVPVLTLPGGGGAARQTTYANGDAASLVYFASVDGTHLAWQTQIYGGDSAYQSVVDAQSGKILYRRSLVNYANGLAWDNYPGAPVGGTQHSVTPDAVAHARRHDADRPEHARLLGHQRRRRG